jgi:RND family efflux transporter MFP subunit
VLLLIGFFFYQKNASSQKKKVESTKVQRGKLEETITLSGEVKADEDVTLRFQTSGRLTWVGIKEGDYVKKYQTIASLDQRELKQSLQKDLNTYTKERLDFEQSKKDNKTSETSSDSVVRDRIQALYQKNQLDLNNSVIDVELQNLALEYANLWTPIAGLVARASSPVAGVNITPSQAEFEIINPSSVYFEATADQDEVTQLFENMNGDLVLDAYPEETLGGNLNHISFLPKSGETNTVYTVKFYFTTDNTSYKYRLGMTGDLTFVTKRKYDTLYLPLKYVKIDAGKKYVMIMKNKQLIKAPVSTGMETDTDIEITSGLKQGDIVYDQTK